MNSLELKCYFCSSILDDEHPAHKDKDEKHKLRTKWLCRDCGRYSMKYGG